MARHITFTARYDIRPVDFNGKRVAISSDEMKVCACCGKRIVRVNETGHGHLIGDECADALVYLDMRQIEDEMKAWRMGCSKKQFRYYQKYAQ